MPARGFRSGAHLAVLKVGVQVHAANSTLQICFQYSSTDALLYVNHIIALCENTTFEGI